MRTILLILFLPICRYGLSQGDSVEVVNLLDSLRRDSAVCKGWYTCWKQARSLHEDGTYVYYTIQDSMRGVWQRFTYCNNHLYLIESRSNDTMRQVKFDEEGCYIIYTLLVVCNDSLSTSDEGGAVYDYYKYVCYDEEGTGRKTWSETTTLVFRRGKPMQRSVHIKYWRGIAIKRKVYVYRAGYT